MKEFHGNSGNRRGKVKSGAGGRVCLRIRQVNTVNSTETLERDAEEGEMEGMFHCKTRVYITNVCQAQSMMVTSKWILGRNLDVILNFLSH